ncbi:hypothetical protein LR48_Vigan07g121100 [Vigna angularis]|uniref:Uncharacterized protein n=1 Tax=Phaseolus angularis TaxID=3914 RepID=A0A0L9UY54_PHAAN|nr:hypothetical protein LR48_Vigan07g121100 [Vigna angularis]
MAIQGPKSGFISKIIETLIPNPSRQLPPRCSTANLSAIEPSRTTVVVAHHAHHHPCTSFSPDSHHQPSPPFIFSIRWHTIHETAALHLSFSRVLHVVTILSATRALPLQHRRCHGRNNLVVVARPSSTVNHHLRPTNPKTQKTQSGHSLSPPSRTTINITISRRRRNPMPIAPSTNGEIKLLHLRFLHRDIEHLFFHYLQSKHKEPEAAIDATERLLHSRNTTIKRTSSHGRLLHQPASPLCSHHHSRTLAKIPSRRRRMGNLFSQI